MGYPMFAVSGRSVRTAAGLRLELEAPVDDWLEFPGLLVVRLAPPPVHEPMLSAALDGQNVLAVDVWGITLWRAEPAASPYFGGRYAEIERVGPLVRLISADGQSIVVDPTSGRVAHRLRRADLTPA